MSGLKIVVFLSSVREGRSADRVFKCVSKILTDKGFIVDVIDPMKEDLPLLKNPLHFYPDPSKAPKQLHVLNQKIVFADAFLMITAEYNFGVPPALSNLINHFPPLSFAFKPCGIISYSGGSGGRIAVSHLENTLNSMGCLLQPYTVNITVVNEAITESGEIKRDHLSENIGILADQIEYVGTAMKKQKESGKLKVPRLNHLF